MNLLNKINQLTDFYFKINFYMKISYKNKSWDVAILL